MRYFAFPLIFYEFTFFSFLRSRLWAPSSAFAGLNFGSILLPPSPPDDHHMYTSHNVHSTTDIESREEEIPHLCSKFRMIDFNKWIKDQANMERLKTHKTRECRGGKKIFTKFSSRIFFFGENVLVREKNFPNIVESCRLTQINWIVNTEERCERNNKADDFNALKQILTISSDDFLFRSCMHSSSSQSREKKEEGQEHINFSRK